MRPNLPYRILLCLLLVALLPGCATMLVGTAASGVKVSHDRRSVGDSVEDMNLDLKASNLLLSDKALFDHTHITATSYNRSILLTGQAETEALRQKVVNKVKQFESVARVIDEIEIGPASSLTERAQDSYITSKVKVNLFDIKMGDFDPTRVKVVTERSVVYLMGLLKPEEQEAVVRKVRYISEVKHVVKVFETVK